MALGISKSGSIEYHAEKKTEQCGIISIEIYILQMLLNLCCWEQ